MNRPKEDIEEQPTPSISDTSSQSPNKHGQSVSLENEDDLTRTKSAISIAETLSLYHEFGFVAIICMAQLMTQAGLGQCLSILHVIGDSFGLSNPGELSWLIAGYSLTVGTFILVAGRLGDLFGYKKMIIVGFSWFSLWSMVAGLSVYSNHVLFIFARVLQGIGPAILLPNSLGILGATYHPGPRKDMVFAFFGATAPVGSVFGSVFGGLFALTWWPWAFFSFALALVVCAVLGVVFIPNPPPKPLAKEPLRQKLRDLDIFGGLSGITALVLINFAWNQAPIVGWQRAYVFVTLMIGALLIPVFFYIELRVAPNPLIPFNALTTDVAFVLACVACGWACFGIWIYYIWQFFQVLRLGSPLLASAWISPVAISGVGAAVATGYLLSRIKPAWVMAMALTMFTVGAIIIATAPVDQSYWVQAFVCTVIMPWGMDMSFPAATVILSNTVAKKHQGIAASLVNTVVNYSISLALGFAGTIEVNVNNGGTTPEDGLIGFRSAWYLAIGLSGLGMVISIAFVLKSYRGDRRKTSGS
ncbi:major facilitator superfamily-domain-containing protein [Clohesyomyces aquaticus]|uniref:Major facilitator superfamily-domain-containing protein n=1 Tax=Clohesyomyces aquaticus TaxID=1231657 RepID=A0A1Y2AA25_9PLEO|nr:major facilitator superfamily-domain-containing protein [Clohesyomyces aquaticus]